MTWVALAAAYALLVAVYCLGHELGRQKGRREGRVVHFHAADVAHMHKRAQEHRARLQSIRSGEGPRGGSGAVSAPRGAKGLAPVAAEPRDFRGPGGSAAY